MNVFLKTVDKINIYPGENQIQRAQNSFQIWCKNTWKLPASSSCCSSSSLVMTHASLIMIHDSWIIITITITTYSRILNSELNSVALEDGEVSKGWELWSWMQLNENENPEAIPADS